MGMNLQECLTYVGNLGFSEVVKRAREELAEITQRANRLGMTSADVERAATLAWNEAVEACAKVVTKDVAMWRAYAASAGYVSPAAAQADDAERHAEAIRALKRTT